MSGRRRKRRRSFPFIRDIIIYAVRGSRCDKPSDRKNDNLKTTMSSADFLAGIPCVCAPLFRINSFLSFFFFFARKLSKLIYTETLAIKTSSAQRTSPNLSFVREFCFVSSGGAAAAHAYTRPEEYAQIVFN